MTIHSSAFDSAQGKPSLSALSYLAENWTSTEISAAVRVCKVVVASGTAGIAAVIPVGAEIMDVVVHCTTSNGSGTMTVKTNALSPATITDAIACVTAQVVARAASIVQAYKIVGADGIAVFANGAADAGVVYIYYKK